MDKQKLLFAIAFAEIINGKYELKILKTLIKYDGAFIGSYAELAKEITGKSDERSNIRRVIMNLQRKKIVIADSDGNFGDCKTVIRLNPYLIDEINRKD